MKPSSLNDYRESIRRVMMRLRENPDTFLSLRDAAKHAHLSPFHFHRVFKEMTGTRFSEFVRRVRLSTAAEALRMSNKSITLIAFDAGYANHESFSRAFAMQYKLSPVRFRRDNRTKGSSMRKAGLSAFNPTIKLVKIPISNFDKSLHYYRDILGLEEEFAVKQYGWAQFNAGGIPLCLYVEGMGGGDGSPGAETGFHLAVDDVEAAFKLLKKRKARFKSSLVTSDEGTAFFVLQDPDANTFKVVSRT